MNVKQSIAKRRLEELERQQKIIDKVNSNFAFLDLVRKYGKPVDGGYLVTADSLKNYFTDISSR